MRGEGGARRVECEGWRVKGSVECGEGRAAREAVGCAAHHGQEEVGLGQNRVRRWGLVQRLGYRLAA